jgi:undecaprenyl-phosphate galactose phosphotransferase
MYKKLLPLISLVIIDLIAFYTSLFMAYISRKLFTQYFDILNQFNLDQVIHIYWIPLIYLIFLAYAGFYTRRDPFWEDARILTKTLTFAFFAIFIFVSVLQLEFQISRSFLFLLWIYSLIIFPLFRYYGKKFLHKIKIWNEPIIIIGNNEESHVLADTFIKMHFLGYEVKGFLDTDKQNIGKRVDIDGIQIPVLGSVEEYCSIAKKYHIEVVIVALKDLPVEVFSKLISNVQQCSRRVIVLPKAKSISMQNIRLMQTLSRNTFLYEVSNNLKKSTSQLGKKLFDITLLILTLPFILPIMAIISALIMLNTRSFSVFFVQDRIGQKGNIFKCVKFKTMYDNNNTILQEYLEKNPDAAKEWETYKKLKSYDPRVTPIGRFLRKTSLDELAQIINITKGEMSFVGPRPYLLEERKDIGEYEPLILEAKPGITGLWQVSGRNELPFEERVKIDAWYILNWSLWLDVFILFKTFKVVTKKHGAY